MLGDVGDEGMLKVKKGIWSRREFRGELDDLMRCWNVDVSGEVKILIDVRRLSLFT